MTKQYISNLIKMIYTILKEAIHGFIDDNAIKLSASLSYYTIFSLPPLLINAIYFFGLFFGEEAVSGEIFWQINAINSVIITFFMSKIFCSLKYCTKVQHLTAIDIQEIIKHVKLSQNNNFAAIVGVTVFIIGASGVFHEMQSSIDFILGLKAKPKNGFLGFLQKRLLSFSMIGSFIFLLLVCLIINTIVDIINKNLISLLPKIKGLFYSLNMSIVFIVILFLFAIIFKLLPDAKIKWKYTMAGASCSTFLFMIGKFAISAYIGISDIASIYGAAGSVIIILIWVYYSAIILYFGAEIVKAYENYNNATIIPNDFSVKVKTIEIEIPKK